MCCCTIVLTPHFSQLKTLKLMWILPVRMQLYLPSPPLNCQRSNNFRVSSSLNNTDCINRLFNWFQFLTDETLGLLSGEQPDCVQGLIFCFLGSPKL